MISEAQDYGRGLGPATLSMEAGVSDMEGMARLQFTESGSAAPCELSMGYIKLLYPCVGLSICSSLLATSLRRTPKNTNEWPYLDAFRFVSIEPFIWDTLLLPICLRLAIQ